MTRRKGMKKIAVMVIFCLIVCCVAWLSAGFQKSQLQLSPQQREIKSQTDKLQEKVLQLERELETLKRVIRISGANVDILANGNVKIRARSVSVEAMANAQVKGTMVTVQASGMNTIKGLPVRIN
jgi:DNA-binding protein YbaB